LTSSSQTTETTPSNSRAGPSTTTSQFGQSPSQLGTSGVVNIINVPSASSRSEAASATALALAAEAALSPPQPPQPPAPTTTPGETGTGSQPAATNEEPATPVRTTPAEIAASVSRAAAATAAAGGGAAAGHMTAAYELGINVDHLRQLMDMGFSVEMCIEALITSNSLHQATDYLLNANTQPTATTTTTTTSTADPSDQEMLRLFTNLKSEEVRGVI